MIASADAVEINGIYYELNSQTKTAEVRSNYNSSDFNYRGEVVIPSTVLYEGETYNVTSIGDNAFGDSSILTSVTIPNSVTSIGNKAFYGCISLASITIPNSVTSIGDQAFYMCFDLTSLTIPNSVTSIGDRAFYGCDMLTSVSISNSLKSIGERVFYNCKRLTSVTIPNSVTSIGNEAFSRCSSLISIDIPNSVTTINESVFRECTSLTSIVLPPSIVTIEGGAFDRCSNLSSIIIPEGVKSIGPSAFWRCTSLTTLSIPNSVTTIESGAFSGCSNLSSINIPDGVESIAGPLFKDCISLTSIDIPNSVTSIGNQAFKGCIKLSSIIIPDGVNYISDYAFSGCTSLTSLSIPNGVTEITSFLCEGCSSLTTVVIGNNVERIVSSAFAGCTGLTDFYCYTKTVPQTSRDIFSESMIENATLHVPASSISLYQASDPWKNFKQIVKISLPEHTLTYMVDGETYKTYSIEEEETIIPETAPTKEGYTFSGWSEIPSTMPANDVTVTGTFTVNKYTLTYKVDGSEYKSYDIEYGSSITPETAPTKEGYTFSGWSNIPTTMPAQDVTVTGTFSVKKYKLTYLVDGVHYKSYDVDYGATITTEAAPTKDGYSFSGWSGLPRTMPANDVTVTGVFYINKYRLSYIVDGSEYNSYDIEYGASINPEAEPTKEGYTFSGWSYIPSTMPANDVTITGIFTINKYKLTYVVDGVEYRSYDIEYGATITPEAAPTKDSYVFSGWSEIPSTMPARDVTITGSFTYVPPTAYTLKYVVDGQVYKTATYYEGDAITREAEPTKEGYTFSGWSYVPSTMPAEDVTVTGSFTVNTYTLTYKVDGVEYKSYNVTYGTSITPETEPTKEGYSFSGWSDIPSTMPARDVTVTGSFTKGAYKLTYKLDGEVYKTISYDYGSSITPEAEPTKEGYTFSGWSEIPSTMPAQDVTVTGTFTVNKYKLIYTVDGEVYKTYDIEYGATITPEAEPTKEGYKFSGWSYTPSKMPAEDVTVVGTFTQEAFVKDNVTYEMNGNDASVTHADNAKGEIVVEASVVINGKSYNVTSIADGAFQGCTGLTSIEIPATVTRIGENAFNGCSSLIVIKIGKDIKEIGSKAFANIGKSNARTRADIELRVYCEAEVLPSTAGDAFENSPIDKGTLYVNDDLIGVYKVVMPWNGFGTVVGLSTGIKSISIDSEDAWIFDMQGNRIDNVRKGVNIIRTRDGKTKKMIVK